MIRGGEQRECANGQCRIVPQSRTVMDDANFVAARVVFASVGYELFVLAGGESFAVGAAAVLLLSLVALYAAWLAWQRPEVSEPR